MKNGQLKTRIDIIQRLKTRAARLRMESFIGVSLTADLLEEAATEIKRLREIEWMYDGLRD